jgi:hypothetical protein
LALIFLVSGYEIGRQRRALAASPEAVCPPPRPGYPHPNDDSYQGGWTVAKKKDPSKCGTCKGDKEALLNPTTKKSLEVLICPKCDLVPAET